MGNFFHAFMTSVDFIQNSLFSKIPLMSTIRMSISSLPNQPRHFVGPDLGLNCLQKLSANKELKAKR